MKYSIPIESTLSQSTIKEIIKDAVERQTNSKVSHVSFIVDGDECVGAKVSFVLTSKND